MVEGARWGRVLAAGVCVVLLCVCGVSGNSSSGSNVCGDGVVGGGEACDDGNRVGGDGCSSVCLGVEYGWTCPSSGGACTRVFECGNGVEEGGAEECDDGNVVSGDGCSRACEVEGGWVCAGGGGAPCVKTPVCGDGFVDVDAGEVCDTGVHDSAGCVNCASVAAGWECYVAGDPCFVKNCSVPLHSDPEVDGGEGSYRPDCAGTCGGFAVVDGCGVCAGGATQTIPGWARDDCGVCFGKNLDKDTCNKCGGGNADIDLCGVCYGANTTCRGCDGVLFSGKVDDVCGICDGDNSTCAGCDGIPVSLGGKIFDICGVCGGSNDGSTPCHLGCDAVVGSGKVFDCAGVCGGPAVEDMCGVCHASASSPDFNRHNDPRPGCGCFGGHGTSLPYTSPNQCGIGCPGNDCTGLALDACGEFGGSGDTCLSSCGANAPIPSIVASEKNVDSCGVCNGPGTSCTDDHDCLGRINHPSPMRFDCLGRCNATGIAYVRNVCGACVQVGDEPIHSLQSLCGCFVGQSSLDECGGCPGAASLLDDCMVCAGGNLDKDDCGVCFGNNFLKDVCGRCNQTVPGATCIGCDFIIGSNRTVDNCGVCGGDHTTCAIPPASTSSRFLVLAVMGGGSLCLLCCVGLIGFLVYRRRQRSFVSKYERQRAAELGNHPTGQVTIVFTDIEGSTSLWENFPTLMAGTIELHHSICRRVIVENNGYEVKTEGDAFMIAFHQPIDAVRFAAKTQLLLLKQKWPAQIMAHPFCQTEKDASGTVVFRGLRVRMGIHTGYPSCRKDDNTGIMDYFGSMVNRAARVEHAASGGQILASARTYEACRVVLESSKSPFVSISLGDKHFKGIKGKMGIYQVMPKQLATRTFKAVTSYNEGNAPAPAGAPGRPSAAAAGARGGSLFANLDGSSSDDDEGFDAFQVGAQRASTSFW